MFDPCYIEVQQLVNHTETNKQQMCLPCYISDALEMCVYVGHKNGKEAHVSIFHARCNVS